MKNYPIVLTLVLLWGCSASTVLTVVADSKTDMYLLDLKDLEGAGTLMGETPVEIEYDKVKGRAIRLERKNTDPQFWYFLDNDADAIRIETKLTAKPVSETNAAKADKSATGETDTNSNTPYRLLMLSYVALSQNRLEDALQNSAQLEKIRPHIAAPHIIRGLTYLQQQNKTEALKSFEMAKSLDPSDASIDSLIGAAKL